MKSQQAWAGLIFVMVLLVLTLWFTAFPLANGGEPDSEHWDLPQPSVLSPTPQATPGWWENLPTLEPWPGMTPSMEREP